MVQRLRLTDNITRVNLVGSTFVSNRHLRMLTSRRVSFRRVEKGEEYRPFRLCHVATIFTPGMHKFKNLGATIFLLNILKLETLPDSGMSYIVECNAAY